MKLFPVNPMAMLGMLNGYNRPLDRHDFPHGTIPDRAGLFMPGMGELRRFTNVGAIAGDTATGQDTFNTNVVTTKQVHPLGTLAISKDGRLFRYGSAGATDLVVGTIVQSAAPITNHLNSTSPAVAIGANSFSFTPGATAGAANLYAEGYLKVSVAPGNGYTYRVSGHPAITSSVAFTLTLDPDEPIQVALTSSSRLGLHHNPWKTVIKAPTTVTAKTVGGAVSIITGNGTSENYGWLQTRGPFAALINGTPAVGTALIISASVSGALDVATFTTTVEVSGRFIAYAMQVGVNTENDLVYLILD